MKVVITGIYGSGGSYLAKHINDNIKNVKLYGISRAHTGLEKNDILSKVKFKAFNCDLCDISSVIKVLEQIKPNIIFNLASNANVRMSFDNSISIFNNNVNSTLNILEAIKILKLKNIKLIQCSTSEVYGIVSKKDTPIKESQSFNPASPYAVSKASQDMLCLTYFYNYGFDIIRTRMFTYLNPLRSDLFATSFVKQAVEIEKGKRNILYHGNLKSVRTILDIRDAMNAYWLSALKCKSGEVYNIGGNKILSVGDFLDIVKSISKVKINSKLDKSLLRPSDVTLQIPDSTKFIKQTSWQPIYSFEESVQFMFDYWRSKIG